MREGQAPHAHRGRASPSGRGTVFSGRAERGTLKINSEVVIIRPIRKTTVTGIGVLQTARRSMGERELWSAAWSEA